jgi:hypothetical protein
VLITTSLAIWLSAFMVAPWIENKFAKRVLN